ncbi:MAG: S-layer homology domain-containing protein [Thermincolia bacterium]
MFNSKKVTKMVLVSTLALGVLASSMPAFANPNRTSDLELPNFSTNIQDAYIPSVSLPTDVIGHWAQNSVSNLVYMGILKGYPDNTFRPNKAVARAEFAAAMKNALFLPNAEEIAELKDLSASHWAAKSVSSVISYLPAYPDGTFRPSAAATREDVAVALVLATGLDKRIVDPTNIDVIFRDAKTVSPDLKKLIAIAVDQKLIKGFKVVEANGQYVDGSGNRYNLYIKAQSFVTRGEMANLIDNAREKVSLGYKVLPVSGE